MLNVDSHSFIYAYVESMKKYKEFIPSFSLLVFNMVLEPRAPIWVEIRRFFNPRLEFLREPWGCLLNTNFQ